MQTITPFLWFDTQAEEAMNFYVSVFKDGEIVRVNRAGDHVMGVEFRLQGQDFMAFNAGPEFKFNEAVSFFVSCDTQAEVDEYWEKLSAGGEESRCGWLKDKFGLSWQIIPKALGQLLGDEDPEKSGRVLQAMLKMGKIEVEGLEKAYRGEE